jgi:GTP-binding protein EngB required for normal cell division
MTAITRVQKEAFLRRCNELPIHVLKKQIDAHEISLDEFIENGLETSKVEEIQALEIKIEEEERKKEEDQAFYDQINNDEKAIDEIQDAIRTGEVTEQGLLDNTEIDKRLLKRIKGYSQITNSPENNDVPLGPGTDIFFFGRSGSGKTCVLASVFNYAEEQGLFIDNTNSMKGINYKNLLVNELNNGVLPDATPASKDAVTYISTTLMEQDADGNPTAEESPLNFIEMSGEFFQKAAKDPDSFKDSIDAHGYLSGSNKKLLFFIVDYDMYSEGNDRKVQSQDFQLILQHLDKYKKALKNTLSIYIIVNKADKFPEDVVDKDDFALDFFMKNFKSVYTTLNSKREKYKFELVSLPFSLGSFMFNNSYLSAINQEWPKKLINSIGKHSSFGKKKGWGVFSSTD